MSARHERLVDALVDQHGETYAKQAGIRLADKPAPLYQLLVLAQLLSARISADVAVAAAKELFTAGYRTPQAMRRASWQDRVDALGRGHYRRYDERTATMLGETADKLIDDWGGDLRRLHAEAGDDPGKLRDQLTTFKGIGPTGADIFLREAQSVWTGISPYVDDRARQAAKALGLPSTPRSLAGLTDSPAQTAQLATALVRVGRSRRTIDELKEASRQSAAR